jgi:hypothetical protein
MLTEFTASGLYYLSELVEEHTVFAKKFLTRLIYAVISIQVLLCLIDGFPFWLSLLSVVSHVVYLGNMRRFPIVKLSDPLFITSCGIDISDLLKSLHTDVDIGLVLLNHWVWFTHFSSSTLMSYPASRYDPSSLPTFTEIASYFGLCVWLVPFSLFVSLSASDNVLPTMGSENKRQGMVKVLVDTIRDGIGELGKLAGWSRRERDF